MSSLQSFASFTVRSPKTFPTADEAQVATVAAPAVPDALPMSAPRHMPTASSGTRQDCVAALQAPAAHRRASAPAPKEAACPHLSPADMRDALRGRVVILVGYPGSGKGTQAKMLVNYLAQTGMPYPHLSTGELFRAEVEAGTAVGEKMRAAMLSGVPVGDDVVFPYLRDKLAKPPYNNGFLLDGFPKNESSYDFLMPWLATHQLPPLVVLHIDVPRAEVQGRLSKRLHCRPCGTDYQPADFASDIKPRCRGCHGALSQRDDDKQAAIVKRLDTFDTFTAPLLARFAARGLLQRVRPAGTTSEAQKSSLQSAVRAALSERALAALPQQSYYISPMLTPPRASVFHNHVDARNPWVLTDILRAVQRAVPQAHNKVYPVAKLVCGPQISDPLFAPVYSQLPNFHAIAMHGNTAVEAFSTGNMGESAFDYAQAQASLEAAFAHPHQGVMTELEEEIYETETDASGTCRTTLDRGLTRGGLDWSALAPWRARALPHTPVFEMHHAIDLPKLANETAPPLAQEALMDLTTAQGFHLGGWFLFAKQDRWALRSNEFTNDTYAHTRTRLDAQGVQLRACVRKLMPEGDVRPVISRASLEKVHAIWRVE